jgi:hypothetical protein
MDNKFYIKRYTNNQITKVNKINLSCLDANFGPEINEQNLISLRRQIEEANLGNFFFKFKIWKITIFC